MPSHSHRVTQTPNQDNFYMHFKTRHISQNCYWSQIYKWFKHQSSCSQSFSPKHIVYSKYSSSVYKIHANYVQAYMSNKIVKIMRTNFGSKQEEQTQRWLTFKYIIKEVVLVMSQIHTSHSKQTVPDLFNACKRHTTSKPWWARI